MMKIQNKIMDGRGYRKYFWYIYIEIRHILWTLFKDVTDPIFMENCEVRNFLYFNFEIKLFWLARYIHDSLNTTEIQKIRHGITVID